MLRDLFSFGETGPGLAARPETHVDAGDGEVLVIPDAQFLFNADFKRSDDDLS